MHRQHIKPIAIEPIGHVRCVRMPARHGTWGGTEAVIELIEALTPAALDGIEQFSHAEILFHCHAISPVRVIVGATRPEASREWPRVGIFAQRDVHRPNRLASTIVRVLGRQARRLWVSELDALEGTPVDDIKPVMLELLPRDDVTQPEWSHELMRGYWRHG